MVYTPVSTVTVQMQVGSRIAWVPSDRTEKLEMVIRVKLHNTARAHPAQWQLASVSVGMRLPLSGAHMVIER